MEDFVVVQKSQLAKLMATENITVEHRKVPTAMFDAKNRVLILPIWNDMDVSMYDHLTGHEVGHAIWTPPDGWHNAVFEEKGRKFYKSFLNVIEDIRIEKKIQRKYPGLKKSFVKSFNTLMERDFFGVKNKNIHSLPFIDRLNIFAKSQYTEEHISFSSEEQILVNKAKSVETWDDVLRVTEEIYNFSKNELKQPSTQENDFQDSFDEFDEFDEESENDFDDSSESDDNPENESDTLGENQKSGQNNNSEEDDSESSDSASEENVNSEVNSEEDEEEKESIYNNEKESRISDSDYQEPRCLTDEHFRSREHEFLSENSKDYVYFDFPKPILDKVVVPYKDVQKNLTDCFASQIDDDIVNNILSFRKANERYVSLLSKEFEMRKAAKKYSKSKNSFTGDLNINKISNYKFDDNLFKKISKSPEGKSHGLIILLDYSGSMQNNMSGSIEQIIVLTMFCKKVNIPFRVFAFSNSTMNAHIDKKINDNGYVIDTFDHSVGTKMLFRSGMFLREYLNSEMPSSEYKKSLDNMILLKESYEKGKIYRNERLGNTPLVEALVACKDIMIDFKKKNNLDITSLVIVQDGDADNVSEIYDNEKQSTGVLNSYYQNIFLFDRKNKIQIKLTKDNFSSSMTKLTIEWFKKLTGSKIVGFFIIPDSKRQIAYSLRNRYFDKDEKQIEGDRQSVYLQCEELTKKMRQDKFLVSQNPSYDKFFMVLGGRSLKTEEEDFFVNKKDLSVSQIKSLFLKQNKRREVNRAFVNKFIETIASE